MYTIASYVWLCLGMTKGLIPLESSLLSLKLGIFCHVLEGIWWRWRQLNSDPNQLIKKLLNSKK